MAAHTDSNPAAVAPHDVVAAVMLEMQGPIAWGRSDCCASAGAVFRRLWGVDLLDGLRAVATERAAIRLARAVGMQTGIERAARNAGLVQRGPHPGALGVIRSEVEAFGGVMAAICITDGRWAARTRGGYAVTPARPLAIWGVPCQP